MGTFLCKVIDHLKITPKLLTVSPPHCNSQGLVAWEEPWSLTVAQPSFSIFLEYIVKIIL